MSNEDIQCKFCGGKTITRELEALGVDSIMRKETEIECFTCKRRYTL